VHVTALVQDIVMVVVQMPKIKAPKNLVKIIHVVIVQLNVILDVDMIAVMNVIHGVVQECVHLGAEQLVMMVVLHIVQALVHQAVIRNVN
jgi:hypothetical protein